MKLRDYQITAVESAITWHRYKDEPAIIVMATGGGKSHVIASIAEHYYALGKRVCILAHRKELLVQNGGKMSIPHGYCSASLGDKDLHLPVIVGGIQTIVNRDFDKFDVIICDECHMIPDNQDMGQYWQFIKKHEGAKLIGLTATNHRLGGGKLTWGHVVCTIHYKVLLDSGYLAPIINKLKNTPDLSSVKIVAGEYHEGQLASVMESPELIDSAIRHIIAYSSDRSRVLIFCVSVRHAELICEAMKINKLNCSMVIGDTDSNSRDRIIDDFNAGKLKYLVNVGVLTTGFDSPAIDMIVCLRPTKSWTLWQQMLGRGCRKAEGKTNALLLDFGGNLKEHGGLGSPPPSGSKKEEKKEHGRICPNCEEFVQPVTAKECSACGYIFIAADPRIVSHDYEPDTDREAAHNPLEEHDVITVSYGEHINRKKNTKSIRITYHTLYEKISEWIAPWSESAWARNKAWQFFRDRGKEIYVTKDNDIASYSVDDLLFFCNSLKKPKRITVDKSDKFPRIIKYEWGDDGEKNDRNGDTKRVDTLDGILSGDTIEF